MPLLHLREVSLSFGSAPILDKVDFQVEAGERVCLLGRNGAGKTSLMRVITGEETPSRGEVIRPGSTVMTRLDQEIPGDIAGTVLEVIHAGLRPDRHEEQWESDVRIDALIAEMKLPGAAQFTALSGGLKRRVLLARALAGQPDVLLLDEPTNHLDLDSILWLEQHLLEHTPTLFFVTHDRSFLRKLSTRIVELDRGRLTSWSCDYDTFLVRKAAALEAEEKNRAAFDKRLAQEEAWIRQGVKARRTRNEGRVRALKKMRAERSERRARQGTVKMEIQEGVTSGLKVIETRGVTFGYGGVPLVRELTLRIDRGEKIGIIGPNGGGKTTLLKLLLGELEPEKGSVKHGTNLQVVYLDQLRGQIDGEKSLAENVAGHAETVTFQGRARHIHGYLQDFLFDTDSIRMPAKLLSGGERNRLLLARLFLQPANVLVLDEPTNDLDAETMELLEDLLVEFSGTLLLVSHDRTFLDNVVTSTLVFEGDGQITDYTGGYEDWVRQRPPPRSAVPPPSPPAPSTPAAQSKAVKSQKFSNRDKKELEELPARIEALEAQKESLIARLGDPVLYKKDPGALPLLEEELHSLETSIATTYARWEALEATRPR
ncbi:MAG: ATP-binding cassette domain-containing protein [Verrucomicrobiae bacterium]|nr:ATP-binding cassette domain-containing protein [Verrucomicrobiae bacterium]